MTRIFQSGPPPVAHPAARRQWGEWHRLTEHRGPACLRLLLEGDCPDCETGLVRSEPWVDHLTAWERDGELVVLVSQPYQYTNAAIIELGRAVAQGAYVKVHNRGWYGHGTFTVEVWRTAQDYYGRRRL